MQKCFLLCLIQLACLPLVQAQPSYHYDIQNTATKGVLQVEWTVKYLAPSGEDSLLIHWTSNALSDDNSSLRQQLLQYQKVDAHFADRSALGKVIIRSAQLNGRDIAVQAQSEFEYLSLAEVGQDSVELRFRFDLHLADARFTGVGLNQRQSIRLANYLPRLAPWDEGQWKSYPIRLQSDTKPTLSSMSCSISLDSAVVLAHNFPVEQRNARKGQIDYYLEGELNDAQLFWGPAIRAYPLTRREKIYIEGAPEAYDLSLPLMRKRIATFFYNEALDSSRFPHLLILEKKISEYQSNGNLLILDKSADGFVRETEWVHALAQWRLRYQLSVDGYEEAWLARGLPYFYKYLYIEKTYPEKRWLPYSMSFLGRFFNLDAFANPYQNAFLYLYLARQNLDQDLDTRVDSLTRLNYEAVTQAKSYLLLNHLRAYVGEYNFRRAMLRYRDQYQDSLKAGPQLQAAMEYYSYRDLSPFFQDALNSNARYELALLDLDNCPTVTTATVKNEGNLQLPYSITTYKDGKAVNTEWFSAQSGKRSVQLIQGEYDYIRLNAHENHLEFSQKDNFTKESGLLQKLEPLRFQFYNSFERPDRAQIFWMPSLNYNAYDKLLMGITLSNGSLVQKRWEYTLGPEYSTGTNRLTGHSALVYNNPRNGSNSLLRQWSAGIFVRYYHYDRDLSYSRISPAVNFYFEDPHAFRKSRQRLRLRLVNVNRELPEDQDVASSIDRASYSVLNLNFKHEYIPITAPLLLNADFQYGDQFSRVSLEIDKRWMLPNKKWLIWRGFAGYFFQADFQNTTPPSYYSFGLSGTQDYLFDYSLIGRSDQSGVWSRQFFTTDGGFKGATGVFADEFMLSTNLSVPIWKFFGLYGDLGYADNFDKTYWDCGFRLAFLTDFLEFYFPIANQDQNLLSQAAYFSQTRFVLDLNLGNIITRLRRGYY